MFGYYSLLGLIAGFILDMIVGDPRVIPHPVQIMGLLISSLEKLFRRIFPKTDTGEKIAGLVLLLIVVILTGGVSLVLLLFCYKLSPWIGFVLETVMCWQCLAAKSLRDESMKVKKALDSGDLAASRSAVSMIVGRDTESLDEAGVARAAVETVAENASDGVIAPLFFLILFGGPLGMVYKAVNTMDSMLGYMDPPYTNIGLIPAKADDVLNYVPSRIAAMFLLFAGGLLGYDTKAGMAVFRRDRYKHASPNAAQTESVMAGLLGVRLAGSAFYRGVLHKKDYIGDDLRPIESEDIARSCSIMLLASMFAILLFGGLKLTLFLLITK